MRRIFSIGAYVALLAASSVAADLYAVTHVDIAGRGDVLTEATNLIKEFAAASQKDPGVVRFEVLQQDGHPNHFTIYEVWQSRQAFEAHLAAPHSKKFREKLQPMLGSPFREGLHRLL
jgi:autoinducer 2-degrading protein